MKTRCTQLKQLTTPFILRRVKTDPRVITDLPEKVETKVYCTLTEEQATLYEAVVQDVMQQIEEEEGMKRARAGVEYADAVEANLQPSSSVFTPGWQARTDVI